VKSERVRRKKGRVEEEGKVLPRWEEYFKELLNIEKEDEKGMRRRMTKKKQEQEEE
jgi:hypothetical protein